MLAPTTQPGVAGPRVLLVTSNGAGMGHLTRLMAYARRLGPGSVAHVFSLSTAVGVIGRVGASWEYCPSHARFPGATTAPWHDMLQSRLTSTVERFGPDVVVFDGTSPYTGLLRTRLAHPELPFIWSRRAMWRAGTPTRALDKGQFFDLVIEPGEIAAAYDRGPTSRLRDALRVGPVTLLDADEAVDGSVARQELGLPLDRPVLLVTLGAGNINDTSSEIGSVVSHMSDRRPDWVVAVTRAPIRTASDDLPDAVRVVRAYPLSRLLNAFDAAVSAAGYNGFHEVVAAGLPTVFVPNSATGADDQAARARFAADEGAGWCVEDLTRGFADVVEALTDFDELAAKSERAMELRRPNGAPQAAAALRRAAGWCR